MKNNLKKSVAIYEAVNSDKIVKFLLTKRFNEKFLAMRENGLLEKCFLDENQNILAKEISGAIHSNILVE